MYQLIRIDYTSCNASAIRNVLLIAVLMLLYAQARLFAPSCARCSYPCVARIFHSKRDTKASKLAFVSLFSFISVLVLNAYIIPPMPAPPAGIAGSGAGISATAASVVSSVDATDTAFWSADLVTFAGSMIPLATMST